MRIKRSGHTSWLRTLRDRIVSPSVGFLRASLLRSSGTNVNFPGWPDERCHLKFEVGLQGAEQDPTDVIEKLVSGGQTGVDRAGLDVALAIGIDCGGWCPKHRRAEDGRIPHCYPLVEADSPNYAARTALNVRDSDGTIILAPGELTGGTALTRDVAHRYGRPLFVVDLDQDPDFEAVERWLTNNRIRTLNVAGPRESQQPGIHDRAANYLQSLFQRANVDASKAPPARRKGPKKKPTS